MLDASMKSEERGTFKGIRWTHRPISLYDQATNRSCNHDHMLFKHFKFRPLLDAGDVAMIDCKAIIIKALSGTVLRDPEIMLSS